VRAGTALLEAWPAKPRAPARVCANRELLCLHAPCKGDAVDTKGACPSDCGKHVKATRIGRVLAYGGKARRTL
jgi:hypothetical protein